MVIVGMLQQIMTATGVRGLLSFAVISTPLILLFILLAVIIPASEGVLTYGGAAIIGIPLIWFLDSIGLHATVAIAGLSLLWPLGDGLPPTALIGRLSVMVSDYKDSYWKFLRSTWVPWILITVVGILMVYFSARLEFLVRWSIQFYEDPMVLLALIAILIWMIISFVLIVLAIKIIFRASTKSHIRILLIPVIIILFIWALFSILVVVGLLITIL